MSKKLSTMLIWGQLIVAVVLIMSAIPQNAGGVQGLPVVSIALTEPSKEAHIGPGENGTVTFGGIVSVTMNQLTRVVVSLSAEDTWNSAVVEPSSLLFTANGDQPFSVSVRAAPGESCNTVGTVTVTGRWTMYPGGLSGPTSSAEGRINIAQYFKFSIDSDNELVETTPGAEAMLKLNINNEGNGRDIFSIELDNFNEISANGIRLDLTISQIEILEFSTESIEIMVETPSGQRALGTHEIRVKVWSEKCLQEGIPEKFFTFNLKVSEYIRSPDSEPGDEEPDLDKVTQELEQTKSDTNIFADQLYIIATIILVVIIIVVLFALGWGGKRSKKSRKTVKITRRKR